MGLVLLVCNQQVVAYTMSYYDCAKPARMKEYDIKSYLVWMSHEWVIQYTATKIEQWEQFIAYGTLRKIYQFVHLDREVKPLEMEPKLFFTQEPWANLEIEYFKIPNRMTAMAFQQKKKERCAGNPADQVHAQRDL